MIKIRFAIESDIDKIVRLHRETLDTLSSKIGENYLKALYSLILTDAKKQLVLVAENNTEIVGVISITKDLEKTKRLLFKSEIIFEVLKALLFQKIRISEIFRRLREEQIISKKVTKNSVYIMTLFVHKNYRNQRIGSKLAKRAFKEAKAKKVFVNTLSTNKNAQKFYESFGFKKIETVLGSEVLRLNNHEEEK